MTENTRSGEDRRGQCPSHEATMLLLEGVRTDMRWYAKTANRLSAVGLSLIGFAIYALIYFGSLGTKVEVLEKNQDKIMTRLGVVELKVEVNTSRAH